MATGTKAALVVAAYEFDDPRFQRLRSPARDVDALADVLGDPAIGGFTVKTVLNQPCPLVQQEIERFFSNRTSDDLLLLYFTCHGVKDGTGRLYFATSDTSFDLLRSTGVSAAFVSEQMELTRSKRIVLLLDCCYSGAFLKGFRARGDDAVSVNQLEGRGRAVITASRATEYAFEADELTAENAQPSIFTGAVIEALATGAADRDGDGSVTVDELYDYVYDHVRGKVAGQTPGRWVNLEGELVIARNPRPQVRPAELSGEMVKAIESEVALHRLGAIWHLREWLEGDDPGRILTARRVLETLSQDYDNRVRSAAATVLTSPTPAPEAPPVAVPVAAAKPEPKAEPSRAAKPEPAARSKPVVHPDGGDEPSDPFTRRIGKAVVGVLVALVLGQAVPYDTVDDSYSQRIADSWNELWILGLGALAGYAALCLLGQGRPRRTGLAIIVGVTPAVVVYALFGMEALVDGNLDGVGPGWVLTEFGSTVFVVVAALAVARLRHDLTVERSWTPPGALLAGAALLVGLGASIAWGKIYFIESDRVTILVSSLVVVTLLLAVLQRHGVPHPWKRWATGVLYIAIGMSFVAAQEAVYSDFRFLSIQYATLVVVAITLPFLAVRLRPATTGVVLLASWSVSMLAAWMGVESDGVASYGYARGAGKLLMVCLLAALALTAVLHQRQHRGPPA